MLQNKHRRPGTQQGERITWLADSLLVCVLGKTALTGEAMLHKSKILWAS